jgi:hypothetical protein
VWNTDPEKGLDPSSGVPPSHDRSFRAQQNRLIVEGAGTNSPKLWSVDFHIAFVTDYSGYAENRRDDAPRFRKDGREDFSFNQIIDYRTVRINRGASCEDTYINYAMNADRSWIDFWAKDYGGFAVTEVALRYQGGIIARHQLFVPRSVDQQQDCIADIWEKSEIEKWNAQYSEEWPTSDLGFINPTDDAEQANPDGPGGLPSHSFVGDKFSEFREYRGFILDGGGYDGAGANGHNGGHKRLSMAYKEFLVEADIMRSNAVPVPPNQLNSIISRNEAVARLNEASAGFSDQTRGAGVKMYWLIDEFVAGPRETFANPQAAVSWTKGHRNDANLKDAIHVVFVDQMAAPPGAAGVLGVSIQTSPGPSAGSFVFVGGIRSIIPAADQNGWIASTIAHELTHTLLKMDGQAPYSDGEHLADPNGDGTPYEEMDPPAAVADVNYLMFGDDRENPSIARNGTAPIRFANADRVNINLLKKESVER